jgi:hypothetical protein
MCDTRFRRQSYTGESMDKFLRRALHPSKEFQKPALSVPTLQRLTGHIDPTWLSDDVFELLISAQSGDWGNEPQDKLVSPALRSIDDFKDCASVVMRAAGVHDGLWGQHGAPLVNEDTGRVHVATDPLTTVAVDPRSPTLWSADDHDLIYNRETTGTGHIDQVARTATASLRLCEFVSRPRIDRRFVDSALRHFRLTGK